MRPLKKKFSEIEPRDNLADWTKHIPSNTPCVVADYLQGRTIADHTGSKLHGFTRPLGILLSGTAEIVETYVADNLRSYRPIRLIREGDLFGDFAIIDNLLCPSPKSRPGESWELCAGVRSVLLKQYVTLAKRRKNFHNNYGDVVETHIFVGTHVSCRAKVAFVDSQFIAKDSPCLDELLRKSWPRAKIYRDCLNSFNFRELLEFKGCAKAIVDAHSRNPIYKRGRAKAAS